MYIRGHVGEFWVALVGKHLHATHLRVTAFAQTILNTEPFPHTMMPAIPFSATGINMVYETPKLKLGSQCRFPRKSNSILLPTEHIQAKIV